MYPHERSLVKKLKDRPFVLIGVNSDKDKVKLKQRMKQENITWRSFWSGPEGTQGRIPSKWHVGIWPTIYLIDAKGVIRHKSYKLLPDGERESDGLRGKALEDAVEKLLAEAEAGQRGRKPGR